MKSKTKKQDKQKYFEEYTKIENKPDDQCFAIIEGVQYKTKEEAKKAIDDLIRDEFNSRNKGG